MKALVTIHTIVDVPNPLYIEGCSESQADNDLLNNLDKYRDEVYDYAEYQLEYDIWRNRELKFDIENIDFEHCL